MEKQTQDNKVVWARLAAWVFLAGAVSWTTWSFVQGGLAWVLLDGELSPEQKLHALQATFMSWGWAAPAVYLAVVVVEVVVAPIPGTLLYAPGGVIFGGLLGGSISTMGNVLGAGIACQISRVLGRSSLERILARSALRRYEETVTRRGVWIVFLLRLNPLTSSDLVSYAAGLTRISVWRVMLGTLLGMGPLCFLQSYLAAELFSAFPYLLYPLIFLCLLYGALVIWILWRLRPASDPQVPQGVPGEPEP